MDLYSAIGELLTEKKRLDRLIASLEAMLDGGEPLPDESPRRRGRKNMSPQERREVSERMKRYWAARREHGFRQGVSSPAP